MKIILIRHGKTDGNITGKYIGSTDEPLCAEGINELTSRAFPSAERVVTSPMKRCVQTAALIYPELPRTENAELRECDFGDFEGMGYAELNGNAEYQKWIDSGGTLPFPHGELRSEFSRRCCNAFEEEAVNGFCIAFVVHGGTIMSVLEKYAVPKRDFYDYQIENGHGFVAEYSSETKTLEITGKF